MVFQKLKGADFAKRYVFCKSVLAIFSVVWYYGIRYKKQTGKDELL